MTNQTDLISEVRAALAAADTTPWEQDEGPYILNSNGHVVCRFWDLEDKYMNDRNNKHLIANAPTWLQQLTDRMEEVVKALEWYGDEKVWTVDVEDQWHPFTQIGADGGKLARATLKRIKGDL